MSNSVKVALYAVLVLLASLSGYFALTNFGRMMARAGERNSELEQIEPERKPAADSAADTNPATATSTSAATNSVENASTKLAENSSTNASASLSTNLAGTNVAVVAEATNAAAAKKAKTTKRAQDVAAKVTSEKHGGHALIWMLLFVVTLVGLGLLIAHDVSQFMGNRALKVLYNDEGAGAKDPEYDKAEEVWANGQYLEAIKMMREYLAKNPREQHVAIRIAEIYEKDLNNNLAAALEYEEVLKQRLQPERWGWSAIHLCNLYFRLGQEQKAYDLLRRIVNEHPTTPAAEKARKRLEQVDGPGITETDQSVTEKQVSATPRVAAASKSTAPSDAPASNLPPGFRPKK